MGEGTGMATTAPDPTSSAGRVPAGERAYRWLRDSIVAGTIEDGRFLDEQWVSGIVGVSRTPVREAFHRLAAERFISLLPRKGAQVRTVTARELEEVYKTRRLIEGHAASVLLAAKAGTPAEMTELLEPMERAGEARDWFECARLNRNFHRAIVAAAGNSVLTELYESLHSRQERVAVAALRARPERLTTINTEHRALVAALDRNDEQEVPRILHLHLQPVSEVTSALSVVTTLRPQPR